MSSESNTVNKPVGNADLRTDVLAGCTVLITRAAHQSLDLSQPLEALGASTICIPLIARALTHDLEALRNAAAQSNNYDWIIFTSANGVAAFDRELTHIGLHWSQITRPQFSATGSATAASLERHGVTVAAIPEEFVSTEIPAMLGALKGKRILLPRADIARQELPEQLKAAGAVVTCVEAYRVLDRSDDPTAVAEIAALKSPPQVVTLLSPSAVRATVALFSRADKSHWWNDIFAVAIGPVTAEEARQLGLVRITVAEPHTVDGIVRAITQQFGARAVS